MVLIIFRDKLISLVPKPSYFLQAALEIKPGETQISKVINGFIGSIPTHHSAGAAETNAAVANCIWPEKKNARAKLEPEKSGGKIIRFMQPQTAAPI